MPIQVLSKGYKKPSYPTRGDLWWTAMEENIQLMNDHDHDGETGAFIGKGSSEVLSGNWGADLGGSLYRQTVTLPDARQFDNSLIEVYLSTGIRVYPKIERVSATTFYIYTNDNTVSFDIRYV